jgi:hypothetical protein
VRALRRSFDVAHAPSGSFQVPSPFCLLSKILARFHGFARCLLNDHSKYMDKPMAFMHLFDHFGGDADEEI